MNIGLPHINCQGITRISEFIKHCCELENIRSPIAIYELDPMLVSVAPPAGIMNLQDAHFNGQYHSFIDDAMDPEFSWRPELYGAGLFRKTGVRAETPPDWQRKRMRVVANTFLGHVYFDAASLRYWLQGAEWLSHVSENVVAFIHPVDMKILETVSVPQGSKYESMLTILREASGIPVLDWERFILDESDFLNFNHVNAWSGMDKLTAQLAEAIFIS